MEEERTYYGNDTMRRIEGTIEDLKNWDSPFCNQRVRAIIITKLEEAALWSQRLVIREEVRA